MHVSGLSERYEGAFEIKTTKSARPVKIPPKNIIVRLHLSGGFSKYIIFLKPLILFIACP
jgi:hypothetical protein